MKAVRPKKFLGQHFLKDLQIAQRIADSLDIFPDIPVIEVGPGMGVLTQFLTDRKDLTLIEIDRESVPYLKERFPSLANNIVEGDFLQLDLSTIYPDKFCVIGNYPYNISSQIFFKVLDYKNQIPCCSGMLQKEVAERIASKPGKKAYGILSVLIQAWYDVEYLFTVDPSVFNPPPKVNSAVIRLIRNERQTLDCNEKLFKSVVKTTFNQRRKTIRNSIKPLLGKDCEICSDPIFNKRPEQLSVKEFEALTNLIEPYITEPLQGKK